jgi:hypothetical protein
LTTGILEVYRHPTASKSVDANVSIQVSTGPTLLVAYFYEWLTPPSHPCVCVVRDESDGF